MSKRILSIGVFVPGLLGGVDEATRHLHRSGSTGECSVRVYTTKGQRTLRAPLVFGQTLAVVVWHRLTGRLDGAHVNMSFRGSTVRKTILGLFLVMLRVPYVIQIHSGGYRGYWAGLGPIRKSLIRLMARRATRVLVLGEPFVPVATEDLGVDPQRVLVVPNGVPLSDFDATDRGQDVANILYLGRLHPDKGVFDLIEALGRLRHLPWTASLAGNDQIERTRQAVADADLADRITVLDWVDRAGARELAERSTVFALPSYSEAMSMSLLEAMGQGMACVATAVGAHGDFLVDAENARVVKPGDIDGLTNALGLLIVDADVRKNLGRAGREVVAKRFDAEVVRRQLEEIYETSFSETAA